ncbi:MAG: AI-2E family transporter, partial [Gammaproteobacteria bacterium]|nr:AI-2E family transporter [Gammaproteobacteria bacterium]
MINFIQDWYRRNFSDPQAALLAVFMAVTFSVILVMGDMLAPFLAAIIIAYLLEGPVHYLQKAWGSRIIAVVVVFLLFMTVLLFL